MRNARALKLARDAIAYTQETEPHILAWARKVNANTFKNMKAKHFLEKYCLVVYASGFKYRVIERHFPAICAAFHHFEAESLMRMKSVASVTKVFGNQRKATCFLEGSQAILSEGFSKFKRRALTSPIHVLQSLPGIGPITVYHLAKDVGLMDKAKPDIWLVRAAQMCNASSVDEMVEFQARELGESQHTVDVAIWTYASAGRLSQ